MQLGVKTAHFLLTAAALLFVASTNAFADNVTYVYIDENGAYHFSSQKQNHNYKAMNIWKNKTFIRDFNAGKFDSYIQTMANKYRVDPALIKAVIRAESAWNPSAVSTAGAQGLMQLMPGTAERLDVADPFDPYQNIEAGTKYLRMMLDTFNGDIMLAVAAYNAGPGAVKKYKGIPPYAETRSYVKIVLRYYREYLKG